MSLGILAICLGVAVDDVGAVDTVEVICLVSLEFPQPDISAVMVSDTIAIHKVRSDCRYAD